MSNAEAASPAERFAPAESLPVEPRWVDPSVVTSVHGRWRLLGTRCRACDARFFPKAFACANCLGTELESVALSTVGRLHVSAVATATQPGFFAPARYGWVNLPAEGIRVFAHILPVQGPDPDGQQVEFAPAVVGRDEDGPLCSIAFRANGGQSR
jgi:uncharacterized OB-fold protein